MTVDENVLGKTLSELFKNSEPLKLDKSNYEQYRFPNYHFCSSPSMSGLYDFLGFQIEKLVVKVDGEQEIKEMLLIIKISDPQLFYNKFVMVYGMPETSSLSKYYIEKHGFKIPTEIEGDSLENYYEGLPKPSKEEFSELSSLAWYDVNKRSDGIPIDIIVYNKTHPNNGFAEKEVRVVFKKAK